MKRAHRRRQGKSALELIEESAHLLRGAPMTTLAAYYAGTIPFVLGLLYFWADMSRNPFANQHLAEAALGMAALFLWMKLCQASFARRIRAQIAAETMAPWSFREGLRVAAVQTILQPLGFPIVGLLILAFEVFVPLGLICTLPFAWLLSFFQNVTAVADRDSSEVKGAFRKAWRLWWLWPRQNILIIAFMSAFTACVFLNWAVVGWSLPGLLKMLFGIESIFTQSPWSMLNTTFFTAMFGLTYLSVDPILRVLYALRCFYGESLQSGEDLKGELRQFAVSTPQLAVFVILLSLAGASIGRAAEATPPAPASADPRIAQPGIPPADLDRSLNDVIQRRKYAWRMPREQIEMGDAEKGPVTRFMEKIVRLVRKWTNAALDWLEELFRKLFGSRRIPSTSGSSQGWIMSLQILLYTLIAAVVAALAILLLRLWQARRQPAAAIASEAIQPAPDLTDENIGADQLPEDGWTKLARELLQRGEFRLAMRAFYLASLAHLAARNLISLARFKSNRDYESELRRRGHSLPQLLPVFGENVSVFERIWYGMHEVNGDLVNRFAANVEKIRTGA